MWFNAPIAVASAHGVTAGKGSVCRAMCWDDGGTRLVGGRDDGQVWSWEIGSAPVQICRTKCQAVLNLRFVADGVVEAVGVMM